MELSSVALGGGKSLWYEDERPSRFSPPVASPVRKGLRLPDEDLWRCRKAMYIICFPRRRLERCLIQIDRGCGMSSRDTPNGDTHTPIFLRLLICVTLDTREALRLTSNVSGNHLLVAASNREKECWILLLAP